MGRIWGAMSIVEFAKNLFRFIYNLATGDDSISIESKYKYGSLLLTLISVVNTFFFLFLHNGGLFLFSLISIAFYYLIQTLCSKKRFLLATNLTFIEIIIYSVFITSYYGNNLGFNLYMPALVVAVFYISSFLKDLKKPSTYAYVMSTVAGIAYLYSVLVKTDATWLETISPGLRITILVFNVLICFFLIIAFSLLFTWEMKNNNALLAKKNEQLIEISSRDPLTGLANRRSMMENLNIYMHHLQKDNRMFSVILCDIDNFKKVNDNYGHDAGDKVLVTVADLITSQLRDTDFVCRWGGEEILIIIDGRLQTACAIAERIRSNIAATVVHHEAYNLNVTMTFGVTQALPSYRIENLIQVVDANLYYGKEHGKNQVVSEIPKS